MSENGQRPVRASDRVSDVLSRDEQLIEVFARQSPHFAKLRKPGMRRVMARLVTVEQAARICGAETSALVHELNRALGFDGVSGESTQDAAHTAHDQHTVTPADRRATTAQAPTTVGTRAPLKPGVRIVELDVREDLHQGREPFSRIMAAVAALRDGEGLCLRATFEPVPLFTVMKRRGFTQYAEQLGTDDWRVWFYRGNGAAASDEPSLSAAPAGPVTSAPAPSAEIAGTANEVVLDVRGLEPPEPMQRTLEALEQLDPDAVLVQVNVRVPHFLLPILRERGFDYELFQPTPERVVVRIWRVATATPTCATPDE